MEKQPKPRTTPKKRLLRVLALLGALSVAFATFVFTASASESVNGVPIVYKQIYAPNRVINRDDVPDQYGYYNVWDRPVTTAVNSYQPNMSGSINMNLLATYSPYAQEQGGGTSVTQSVMYATGYKYSTGGGLVEMDYTPSSMYSKFGGYGSNTTYSGHVMEWDSMTLQSYHINNNNTYAHIWRVTNETPSVYVNLYLHYHYTIIVYDDSYNTHYVDTYVNHDIYNTFANGAPVDNLNKYLVVRPMNDLVNLLDALNFEITTPNGKAYAVKSVQLEVIPMTRSVDYDSEFDVVEYGNPSETSITFNRFCEQSLVYPIIQNTEDPTQDWGAISYGIVDAEDGVLIKSISGFIGSLFSFISVPLFYVDQLPISIGTLLSVVVALGLFSYFLKVFAGG